MNKPVNKTFAALSLSNSILRAIEELGFLEMTEVQAATLPALLAGHDLIGQAKTGSGKTAAFVLPILQKVDVVDRRPQALILCPTRELCDQVVREVRKFAKNMPQLRAVALLGGQSYVPQEEALANGIHIAVGTPGRTLEFLKNGKLEAGRIATLVLDEADRMLELSFSEDMKAIRDHLPAQRQTVFFSATFSEEFDRTWLKPNAVKIQIAATAADRPKIASYLFEAEKPEKLAALFAVLQKFPSESTLVFCRTKASVNEIGAALKEAGACVDILHSDLNQSARDRNTAMFRNGSLRILIATDVAARGIDIDTLALVINFDLPPSADIFIHRIGRTGRAGRSGVAVSLATEYERELVLQFEKATGIPFSRETLTAAAPDFKWPQSEIRTIQMAAGHSQKISAHVISQAIGAADVRGVIVFDRVTYIAVHESVADEVLARLSAARFGGEPVRVRIL